MKSSTIGGGIVALVVLVLVVFFLGRESGAPVLERVGLGGGNTFLLDRVIDGDTFVIANGDSVRIIGIDAPEGTECYAQESGQALTELLTGKNVRLEKDISGVDNFGRLLRHVHLEVADPKSDNIQVGAYMLREGFAISS